MNYKRLNILSNAALGLALITAAYAFVQIYLSRRGLAPGVCPIDDNRLMMFVAIGLAITSLVLSFVADKRKGKDKPAEDETGTK